MQEYNRRKEQWNEFIDQMPNISWLKEYMKVLDNLPTVSDKVPKGILLFLLSFVFYSAYCTYLTGVPEDFICQMTPYSSFPISKYMDILLKGSLSYWRNENEIDKDLFCIFQEFVHICFIQRNLGHKDSVMHEFSSSENEVNKAVAKVREIGTDFL